MNRFRIFLLLTFSLFTLLSSGCKVEKAPDDLQPAQRVELIQLNQSDPRPFFHAELKFKNPGRIELPSNNEELKNRIKIREAGSRFVREGKEFTPFKVTSHIVENKVEQIGIDFFTQRSSYQQLKTTNLDVRIETLDGKTLQGRLPFACRTAAGCAPERAMTPDEIRLVAERDDAPPPPNPHWKELLWLTARFALALAVLVGLWYGVPRLAWPASPPPKLPVRGAVKPALPKIPPKGRLAGPIPTGPPADYTPRKSLEETRFYNEPGPK